MKARLARLGHDERGLVKGLLAQVILMILVLGLLIHEGGQVAFAQFRSHDVAAAAAEAAADTWYVSSDFSRAKAAADHAARSEDESARVTSFEVEPDGTTVVTVRVVASTLLVKRISFLREYTLQHGTEQARRTD